MHAENFCKLNHFSCYFQNKKTNHLLFLLRLHSDRCDTGGCRSRLAKQIYLCILFSFCKGDDDKQEQYCCWVFPVKGPTAVLFLQEEWVCNSSPILHLFCRVCSDGGDDWGIQERKKRVFLSLLSRKRFCIVFLFARLM